MAAAPSIKQHALTKEELEAIDYNTLNECCNEGFHLNSTSQKAHFQKNFSKKLYNGFVDTYSVKEVDMLKKRGALSGCIKPSNHYDLAVQNAIPTNSYNIFHK